jgi:hypothetical protein
LNKKRLFGGFLATIGFLLSPLSWWNDPLVNIPIAMAIGWLASFISPRCFLPFAIIGYWSTNVLGLVLMHHGLSNWVERYKSGEKQKKELWHHVWISIGYTLLIILLASLRIIRLPPHGYFK